jgi:hypothetical protein
MTAAEKPVVERDPSLHVLQHALGMDDYGRQPDGDYRNHYVTDEGCDGWDLCMAHVDAGRMRRHGPRDLFGGPTSYCFVVTEAGREFVREHSPKPPKVSRSKARYRRWLESEVDMSFGQWVKEGWDRNG